MRHYCLCLLLLIVAGRLALDAVAQPQQWTIERLTMNDGLPENRFTGLTQDEQGFLWAATGQSGLVRYDGYTFRTYTHDDTDPASLANDTLRAVHTDQAGVLWVGTLDGLDQFDRGTDSFIHYRHDPSDPASLSGGQVTEVLEDRQGHLWVGTNAGLNKMDRATGTFTHYRHDPDDPHSLAHDYVTALYEDREGTLWVGTRGGLHRLDADYGEGVPSPSFTRYQHNPADSTTLWRNYVGTIYEDSRGNLWVGTWGSTLHRMDRRTGRFTRFQELGFYGTITTIEEDVSGALWVGANSAGIQRFWHEEDRLTADVIYGLLYLQGSQSVYQSQEGILWFGTNAGLLRVVPAPQPITFHPIMAPTVQRPVVLSLLKDRDGLLWVGTEAGLLRYDPTSGASTWYRHDPGDPASLKDDFVFAIMEDRAGNLWLSTVSAIHRLDPKTNTITRIKDQFVPMGSVEDQRGNIWSGGEGSGAFKVDPTSGVITAYPHVENDPTSIGSNNVQYIVKSHDGTHWIGLDNGFSRYNPDTDTYTSYFPQADSTSTVTSRDVHAFIEDRHGRLWYGSPHDQPGLNRLDPETGHFEHVPSPASTVYSFLDDEQGNLWMATDAGLLMYDMAEDTFVSYADHPVLEAWEVGGFDMGAYKDAAGRLHFGAVGGIYSFDPKQLRALAASPPPQIALTALHVGLDEVEHGEEALLQQPIWEAETITLGHTENSFSITFAALHYKHPANNRHQYMLEGYDETWREAGADRRAEYVKVPPGTYVFRAKAANSNGVWSEEEATIHVRVLPPWWRTTWAYGLYGLLLLVGVFAVDRVQRRRLLAKEREKARERELEQAKKIEQAYHQLRETKDRLVQQEKMASLGALTAGIAHEIKNPLNFINNFAEVNEELAQELREALANGESVDDIIADLEQNAAVIAQHGKRADGIVKSMMAHAREGKGEREAVNLNALIDEHVELAYHGKRAQVPGFNATIERDYDEAVGQVEIMPQDFGRVILNLMGNAFDAVMERAAQVNGQYEPEVTISTRRVDNRIEIRVADNGPGMSAEVKAKVFEPFFTTKPTGSGTGLGLSLSYDIITQGHGGTLTVESEVGEGAAFILTLPEAPTNAQA